jgi:Domain of unknown function (DUF6250)
MENLNKIIPNYSLKLIADDNFSSIKNWIVEKDPESNVIFQNNKLELYSPKGTTVWYKKKLDAPVMVEYYVEMISKGGEYDNITDLNCFFMAHDPHNKDDIFAKTENRKMSTLKSYSNLPMYYVGYGANGNTTTRLRRLHGDGKRPMLPEHDLKGYKNKANEKMKVNILLIEDNFIFCVDNKIIFDWHDPRPETAGWFGFRTYFSHMYISDFKVYSICY